MKQYIRFGDIPKDGRSINYFKLTYEQQNVLDYEDYPNEVKEVGLSVFEIKDNKPLLDNLQLITTLHARIKDNYKAYIVVGNEIAKGNDNEPLLSNVEIIGEYLYTKNEMYEYILSILKTKYLSYKDTNEESEFIGKFYYPKEVLICNSIEFKNPIDGFDDTLGYRNR